MRILIVADHFPPASGGLAVQCERLADRLGALGHEMVVFTVGKASSRERRANFELVRQPLSLDRLPGVYQEGSPEFHPPWPDPEFRRGLAVVTREHRPDVMHVHGWSAFSAASLPGPPAPIVVTLHDYGFECPKKSLMRHGSDCAHGRGLRCVSCDSAAQPTPRRTALALALGAGVPWVGRRVARWIAVSDYVAKRHARLPMAQSRVQVIPPLVDLPRASSTPPRHPPYFLYAGAGPENPDKGRDVLLEAFSQAEAGDYRLVLVGGRERYAAPGIEDRGYLKGAELVEAFRGATFAVVPSIWPDPCPAVAVEALAWGRPVIASATGGLSEIVQHERTGLHVAPGDSNALAAALARMMRDDGLRTAMAEAAPDSVARFATERVLEQHEQLYRNLAGLGRSAVRCA